MADKALDSVGEGSGFLKSIVILAKIDDFSGFSFRRKFEPIGDVIGYDLQFE